MKPIETIQKDISKIRIIQSRQEIILRDHIQRTNALEKILLPIQKRFYMIEGIAWFLSVVGLGSIIVYAMAHLKMF